MQQHPMILVSNDVKSCYDQLVHSITSMVMKRLGMPIEPIRCMLVTIQNMKHYVRTDFGKSRVTISRHLSRKWLCLYLMSCYNCAINGDDA